MFWLKTQHGTGGRLVPGDVLANGGGSILAVLLALLWQLMIAGRCLGYMLANVARLHVGGIGGGVVENSRLPAGAGCNPRGVPVASWCLRCMLAKGAWLHAGGIAGGVVENSRLPAGARAITGTELYKQMGLAGCRLQSQGGTGGRPVPGVHVGQMLLVPFWR